MTDLTPYLGGATSPDRRTNRALSRQLGAIKQSETLALAQIETEAKLGGSKVQAIGFIAMQADEAVTLLTQAEVALSEACPAAMGRLRTINDAAAIGMASVVMNTAWKLSR